MVGPLSPHVQVSWESSFVKDGLIPKSTALKEHGGDLPVSRDGPAGASLSPSWPSH